MKRIGALGGIASFLLLTNACSSTGAGSSPSRSGDPVASPTSRPRLRELNTTDTSLEVRGSTARVDLKRVGRLAYDVAYVTPSGERRLLAPAVAREMNPIVDARSHGARTIVCVSSFSADDTPTRVECVLLETASGHVLDRTVVANALLRTLPAGGVGAYISPEGPAHFEPEGRLGCRAIKLDASGRHLEYDAKTVSICDEAPIRVAPSKIVGPHRGPREPLAREKLPGAATVRTTNRPVMTIAQSRALVSPAAPLPTSAPNGLAPGEEGEAEVDDEASGCGGPLPTSHPVTTRLGPPAIPGLDRIAFGRTSPDWILPGWTLSHTLDVRGESVHSSDAPHCMNDTVSEWGAVHGTLSLGPLVGSLNVDYNHESSDCDTLECRDENGAINHNGPGFACGAPGGVSETRSLAVDWTLGGSIPLDVIPIPPLQAFCAGTPAFGFVPPIGLSCNLDLLGSGGFSENTSNSVGGSMCGSMCEDGRSTKYVDKRESSGFQGALEVEFAVGTLLGNGRAGISYESSKTVGEIDEVTCTDAHVEQFRCSNQLVVAYARGCVGNSYVSYCFDLSKTLYRDHEGDCPPLPDPYSGGTSPGTAAGQACADQATDFWTMTTYADQCRQCCNELPAVGADPASFDAECKQACDAL